MNYLLMIKTFLAAVKTIEALMPASPGKEKFDVVMAITEDVVGSVASFAPALTMLATNAVNTYRAVGAHGFTTAA